MKKTIKKISFVLEKKEKHKAFVMLICSIMTAFLETATAGLLVLWVKAGAIPNIKIFGNDLSLSMITTALGITFLLKVFFTIFESYYQNFKIREIVSSIVKRVFRSYARLPYIDYIKKNSSYYQSVLETDSDKLGTLMLSITACVAECIIALFLMGFLFFLEKKIFLNIVVLACLGWMVQRFFLSKILKKIGIQWQDERVFATKTTYQFFHGFKEIVLRNNTEIFLNHAHEHLKKRERSRAFYDFLSVLNRPILEFGFFVIVFAMISTHKNNEILPIMGGFAYAGFRLIPSLTRIAHQLTSIRFYEPSLNVIVDALKSSQELMQTQNSFQFEKGITFQSVSFFFQKEVPILKDVTFFIKKGEKIGITGETGSGKSTLLDILLGFLNPMSGSVLIDDQYPVNCLEWRSLIGYVPQSIYLLDASIKENILFGAIGCDEEKLANVICQSQLEHLIEKLPDGVNTIVGERGVKLSGGERQRIAIARALYTNPEVIIFDEATSALDHETEQKIMDTIYEVGKQKTLIMIAHRLSTLEKCDRIIRIEKGYNVV